MSNFFENHHTLNNQEQPRPNLEQIKAQIDAKRGAIEALQKQLTKNETELKQLKELQKVEETNQEYQNLSAVISSIDSFENNLPKLARSLVNHKDAPHIHSAVFRLVTKLAIQDYIQKNNQIVLTEKQESDFYRILENNYIYDKTNNQIVLQNKAVAIAGLQKTDIDELTKIKLNTDILVQKLNSELKERESIPVHNSEIEIPVVSEILIDVIGTKLEYYKLNKILLKPGSESAISIKITRYDPKSEKKSENDKWQDVPFYSENGQQIPSKICPKGRKIFFGRSRIAASEAIESETHDDYILNPNGVVSGKHLTLEYLPNENLKITDHSRHGTTVLVPYK